MQPKKNTRDRRAKFAAILAGAVLAVACNYVPEKYQAACETAAKIAAIGSCGG